LIGVRNYHLYKAPVCTGFSASLIPLTYRYISSILPVLHQNHTKAHMTEKLDLYPGEVWYRKLQEISKAIGVEQNMLLKIDSNWHSHIRKKVFTKSSLE
jgi:hypothetical protein